MFSTLLRRMLAGPPGPVGPMGPMGPPGPAPKPDPNLYETLTPPAVKFFTISDYATTPERAHGTDAGLDLHALHDVKLLPGGRAVIPTAVMVEGGLPVGWVGLVCSRSGLAARHGLQVLNAPGVVDPGYTGELQVILHNTTREPYWVRAGDAVAQLLVMPCATGTMDSARGDQGLGSTGALGAAAPEMEDPRTEAPSTHDPVERPSHYTEHPVFPGQAWDVTKFLPFAEGNAVKYLWRHGGKGSLVQDLEKARWYLDKAADMTDPVGRVRDVPRDTLERLGTELAKFWATLPENYVQARATPARKRQERLKDLPGVELANGEVLLDLTREERAAVASAEAYRAIMFIITGAPGVAMDCVKAALSLLNSDPDQAVPMPLAAITPHGWGR